ncbi:hypothetical protein REO92_004835 [Citrobacter freundii]|uniref:hypothetical protein n=1 Tax=Citrobacter TaxID=544 RepID=UPI00190628E2|nr:MULTISPECIES: hypothetical protein [Citrobacter]EKZ3395857.1 hypothetical protein [Citrobacter freundii]EKZ3406555.1 hypothetical protein [Citrobacter freundii]MBJ9053489.1 hypothetical protein [Citrobacter freundii]MDM3225669.1 hypothetical protein [Citrobacter sp. Cf087]CAE7419154.1 hypothetical protein AI2666V1_2929 [Citrobacter freundii]
MNISPPKKITTLKYFVDAYPESITDAAWKDLVDEIGNLKEVYGYIAFLHDDGFLKGKISFDGSGTNEGSWMIDLSSLRVTSQGYEYWRKKKTEASLRSNEIF